MVIVSRKYFPTQEIFLDSEIFLAYTSNMPETNQTLSPEAKVLGKRLEEIRQRLDKAKEEVVSLTRTAVLVLKDHSPSLCSELERRLFLVDSESAELGNLLKGEGNMNAFMELLTGVKR